MPKKKIVSFLTDEELTSALEEKMKGRWPTISSMIRDILRAFVKEESFDSLKQGIRLLCPLCDHPRLLSKESGWPKIRCTNWKCGAKFRLKLSKG